MSNLFGEIPISDYNNLILREILHTVTKSDLRGTDIDAVNGTLTELQWETLDYFAVPKEDRPSYMAVARHRGKNSISSVQAPLQAGVKKLIEAIITVGMLVQDDAVMDYLMETFVGGLK